MISNSNPPSNPQQIVAIKSRSFVFVPAGEVETHWSFGRRTHESVEKSFPHSWMAQHFHCCHLSRQPSSGGWTSREVLRLMAEFEGCRVIPAMLYKTNTGEYRLDNAMSAKTNWAWMNLRRTAFEDDIVRERRRNAKRNLHGRCGSGKFHRFQLFTGDHRRVLLEMLFPKCHQLRVLHH